MSQCKQHLVMAVILACLISLVSVLSPLNRVLAYDEEFLEVTFWFDKDEEYPKKAKDVAVFTIKDSFVADRTGDVWVVRGYFLSFEKDAYIWGIGGHKGDIEGAWMFKSMRTGAIVTALTAHYNIQTRQELAYDAARNLKPLHIYIGKNKHGAYHEPGVHWGWVPYRANGKGYKITDQQFQDKDAPVYEGEEGAIQLAEKVNWMDDNPKKWRLKPITASMLDGGKIYNRLLDSTLSLEGKVKISSLVDEELGGVDFTSARLTYISADVESRSGEPGFRYVLKATRAEEGDQIIDVDEAEVRSLVWFLTGLILPDEKFWVNLNPKEPERIVDAAVGKTGVGEIMLEADLQMKRDFCKYENPGEGSLGSGVLAMAG